MSGTNKAPCGSKSTTCLSNLLFSLLGKHVVDFEPHGALFVPDNNPLLFYEKIAKFGRSHLNYNGKVYMETHEDYTKDVAALFSQTYQQVLIRKDLFGKERMVIATY